MSSVVISGDTSGAITLAAPAIAGTNTITLPATTGTMALTTDVIGVGQTWTAFTSVTRALATTYTNSTGKPIMVIFGMQGSGQVTINIGGFTFTAQATNTANGNNNTTFIVQNSLTYSITNSGGTTTWVQWVELR